MKIKAEIVADSINQQGDRITTYLLTFPRFILAELNTHRMFSKNSASSRAIPFEKMVKMVEEEPFIPIAWQSKHSGMQGTEYLDGESEQKLLVNKWLEARDLAVQQSKLLNNSNVTKQLCNRLLEPFMWHTVLLTATEFENFFELRCPEYVDTVYGEEKSSGVWRSRKDYAKHFNISVGDKTDSQWLKLNKGQAEIHMMALAEAIYDAMNESTPKELKAGEWHIPFGDKISDGELRDYFYNVKNNPDPSFTAYQEAKLKVSTARCARLSYMTFDGEIDYKKDIKLYDTLLESRHMSPFEHCARAMSDEEYYEFAKGRLLVHDGYGDGDSLEQNFEGDTPGWCNNFKGFIQYRYLIEERQ